MTLGFLIQNSAILTTISVICSCHSSLCISLTYFQKIKVKNVMKLSQLINFIFNLSVLFLFTRISIKALLPFIYAFCK